MITNEYNVTKDLYLSWNKENRKKGVQLRITIMWSVILLILIAATVAFMLTPEHGDPVPWLALEVVFFLYTIYHLFFRRRVAASRMYDKMAQQLGENWKKTIVFGKDVFTDRQGDWTVKFPYSEIVSVRDNGNTIYIETEKKIVVRLYKDKFTVGDYAEFRRFIESKAVMKCFLK